VLAEADMASVVERNGVSNDVLEVDSARGTLKSPRAAALNDGMLAASAKLYPARHVRIPLRFESVRGREGSHGSAISCSYGGTKCSDTRCDSPRWCQCDWLASRCGG
jgi:hypothetical protein